MTVNRKEQIEKQFLPKLIKQMQKAGCSLNEKGIELIKAEMRTVAMVGAFEERGHCLKVSTRKQYDEITGVSILAVLGYE